MLSGHAQLEQCKAEQAEVDLERRLTIHYNLCDDPGSVCFQQQNESCEPEQEFEEIIEAKLVDQTGNSHRLKVQDDKKGFHVRLIMINNHTCDSLVFSNKGFASRGGEKVHKHWHLSL